MTMAARKNTKAGRLKAQKSWSIWWCAVVLVTSTLEVPSVMGMVLVVLVVLGVL
jgi:hypothetical protein